MTGEESRLRSSRFLSKMLKTADLTDAWRMKNPFNRQYTCVIISDAQVGAVRLDRFYISGSFITRVLNGLIFPVGFSDNLLISIEITFSFTKKQQDFGCFNVKLL